MVWTPGTKLQNGKYLIQTILGQGGFGITYLARKHSTERGEEWVVIKTLRSEIRHRPDLADYQTKLEQDFLNEALKLAQCKHPHVVQVKELIREETPEGTIDGIVMEYIQGKSLAEHLGRGVLPEAEALRYIRHIGNALTVVHSLGLLHRDVKPQNIMVRAGTSEAVLIDFGLAREFMPNLTQTHTESRTEGFAPLEQYDRRAKRGAYTDVYALAATLYCLLTGNIPRPAPNRSAGTPLESPKQYNSAISDYVNKAILKGMALRVDDRPQSMQAWLRLLEPSAPPRPTPSPTPTPEQPFNPFLEHPSLLTIDKILWGLLSGSLIGGGLVGFSLAIPHTPLWVLAALWAWLVAWLGGASGLWHGAWSIAANVVVVTAWTASGAVYRMSWGTWAVFLVGFLALALVGGVIKWVREELHRSFSRIHILILAATFGVGLILGTVIATQAS